MWTLFSTEKETTLLECIILLGIIPEDMQSSPSFSQIRRTTDIFDWGTESGFQTL